jgi:hypothetical protein
VNFRGENIRRKKFIKFQLFFFQKQSFAKKLSYVLFLSALLLFFVQKFRTLFCEQRFVRQGLTMYRKTCFLCLLLVATKQKKGLRDLNLCHFVDSHLLRLSLKQRPWVFSFFLMRKSEKTLRLFYCRCFLVFFFFVFSSWVQNGEGFHVFGIGSWNMGEISKGSHLCFEKVPSRDCFSVSKERKMGRDVCCSAKCFSNLEFFHAKLEYECIFMSWIHVFGLIISLKTIVICSWSEHTKFELAK